jgi:hypothetical protein
MYEPREQWNRLKANRQITPAIKYTAGALSVIKYSLLPGRLFKNDEYNPYTGTLSLNSSKPIEALCEAGSAKIHHQQSWPGAYAASQNIPFVPLGHKAKIASDVITYAHVIGDSTLEKELYPHTYADMAKSSIAQTLTLFPVGTGVTQFVVPFAAEFAAEESGRLVGKRVANDSIPQSDRHKESRPAPSTTLREDNQPYLSIGRGSK